MADVCDTKTAPIIDRDEHYALYASSKGRMSKGQIWVGLLRAFIFNIGMAVLFVIVVAVALQSSNGDIYIQVFFWVVLICNAVFLTYLFIKRSHDRDHSGLDILLLFVPVVGFYVLYEFLSHKGIQGPNKYGPDPLMQDHHQISSHAQPGYSNSESNCALEFRIEDVPALVYLFPDDWSIRKSFLTSDIDRDQAPVSPRTLR